MGPLFVFLIALPTLVAAIPMTWYVARDAGGGAGQKNCAVISLGNDVTAQLDEAPEAGKPVWSVRVGFDNHPGSLRYLRINEAYYTTDQESFTGAEAEEIVQHLKSPGEFAFEWAKGPEHAKRPGLFGTGDFAAKAAECERWISGTRI